MIRLHFSECGPVVLASNIITSVPFLPYTKERGPFYENYLLHCKDASDLVTYDELCVLVAQFLRRTKKFPIKLVSWCSCPPGNQNWPHMRTIPLDDDGDMIGETHHGFFNQRLKYLR